MRRVLGLFAGVMLLVACGARTGLRTTGDAGAAAPEIVRGIVLDECAPNDGAALLFSLGMGVDAAPTCQIPGLVTGVLVLIWDPLPQGPGTFIIGDGSFASGSSGYVCTAKNTCEQATSGTLVITALTTTSVSGTYTLTSALGTTSESFEAVVCNNPLMCG